MIGIVGGIGPAAGLNLARIITTVKTAQSDQDHIPWILLNLPGTITDRTKFLLGEVEENPADQLARQLIMLEQAGCTVAGMACNTAHAPPIFDRIMEILNKSRSQIKVLHVIDEMIREVKNSLPAEAKMGILGTTGSYQLKLHERPLVQAGFDVIDLGTEQQSKWIHTAIYHQEWGIKARSSSTKENLALLQHAVDHYLANHANALVLGCSEITLVVNELKTRELKIVKPMEILAHALVRYYESQ